MPNRGKNKIKLTIALAVTALTLTGFAPERSGHGHSGHSSHGGGGGGCSSSHSDHDSSSSSNDYGGSSSSGSSYGDDDSYTDDDTYGSGGGSSRTSGGSYNRYPTHHHTSSPTGSSTAQLKDAKVKLVSCASESKPYATVQVSNGNAEKGHFQVSVTFLAADGTVVDTVSEEVDVPGKDKKTSKIQLAYSGDADSVDHCDVAPTATPYQ